MVLPSTIEKTSTQHESWLVVNGHSSSMSLPSIWHHLYCDLPTYSWAWFSMKLSVHSQPGVSVTSFNHFPWVCILLFCLLLFLFWIMGSLSTEAVSLHPCAPSAWTIPDTHWVISTCWDLTATNFAQDKGIKDPASALCWLLNHSLKLL